MNPPPTTDSASDRMCFQENIASEGTNALTIQGEGLSLRDIVRVAREGHCVRLPEGDVLKKVAASRAFIQHAVEAGEAIYGVTTLFGGMANVVVHKEAASALQNNLPFSHKTGCGPYLRNEDVRAAMLLRANALLRGASGVRLELIRRLIVFLNRNATPRIHCHGSIGASGDLVPLAYIAGSICGLSPSFRVHFEDEEMDALTVLDRLGLPRLSLEPKEGLALMNGTSVMTGVAATCTADALQMLAMEVCVHGIFAQALRASDESFQPFIHRHKPHLGQNWVAAQMLNLLMGSSLSRTEGGKGRDRSPGELFQDRYSLRCLPQFLGPIIDGMMTIAGQIEVEANSATDNPLIDADAGIVYHGGNFLGQYIGVGMDQLRYHLGMLIKHLDVQIALLVAPEFNNGLPASLVGNRQSGINTGLKALQLTANSLMPRISFFGQSIADRFPTHAEQFNQNINSLGLGSAVLARESLEACYQYMAVALIFAAQAADLRTFQRFDHYNAQETLSETTRTLYEAVKRIAGLEPSRERPYIWDDADQALDEHIAALVGDMQNADGQIARAVDPVLSNLLAYYA
ncbi:MAG: aromatic amino acid ammonia-lyase [Acidobacteriaceae bacterium]